MKIRPVGAELFHADGRTNKRRLILAFRNSANALNNEHNGMDMCSAAVQPNFTYINESSIPTIKENNIRRGTVAEIHNTSTVKNASAHDYAL
jgi:hypothetical protein